MELNVPKYVLIKTSGRELPYNLVGNDGIATTLTIEAFTKQSYDIGIATVLRGQLVDYAERRIESEKRVVELQRQIEEELDRVKLDESEMETLQTKIDLLKNLN